MPALWYIYGRYSIMKNTNELIHETSPYLLQHAHNPVQWRAWNDQTIALAQKENKPLLISIGYAACHWCHVMEKETFQNEEAAELMNENFICIKVDREERPDVDQIYMASAQLISGQGGWPLHALAFPDGKPFFAGTYFPRKRWMDMLRYFIEQYKQNTEALREQAEHLSKGIRDFNIALSEDEAPDFSGEDLQKIKQNLLPRLDSLHGGITGNIKFPMPSVWELMMEFYFKDPDERLRDLLKLTLDNMANGGIYDQLGGGFSRYATDPAWIVPHFEKMLYDNAQLISLYSHAFQLTGNETYKTVTGETIDFVVRDLSAGKGYYAAIDADSDGKEGAYYVWTIDEIRQTLKENAGEFIEAFGVSAGGNFEEGKNVLFRKNKQSWNDEKINELRKQLLDQRNNRTMPAIDTKVLTSWNAMMSIALADAAAVQENDDWKAGSKNILDFLLSELMKPGNELYRNYQPGRAMTHGFLDDYAFLIKALIQYYQASFEMHYLHKAKELAEYVLEHFYSAETKMFFYNNNKYQGVFTRPLEFSDNVIPSSNAVMAENLYLLGLFYNEDLWVRRAGIMVKNLKHSIIAEPTYHSYWARLMMKLVKPPFEIAIVGEKAHEFLHAFRQYYLPDCIFSGNTGESDLPLLKLKYVRNETLIYVCINRSCQKPVSTVDEALQQLIHLRKQ